MKKNKNKEEKIEVVTHPAEERTYSQEEIDAYQKRGFWSKVPFWIKAVLIKYWFFGAIVFFVMMGIPSLDSLTYSLICGLIGGAIIDIACNSILIMLESDKKEAQHFMIYKSKVWSGVLSLIVNILFVTVIFIACAYFCDWIVSLYKDPAKVWFLQEPLSIALVLLTFDLILLGIKYLVKLLFKKTRKNN